MFYEEEEIDEKLNALGIALLENSNPAKDPLEDIIKALKH